MAKKLTVELFDNGAPATGVAVKVSGCSELLTSPTGAAFFLVEADTVLVTVAGQQVHASSLDTLPPRINLNKVGGGWTPA